MSVHLSIDSLIDRTSGDQHNLLIWERDNRGPMTIIHGYISVDDSMWTPYVDCDGNTYYTLSLIDFGDDYEKQYGQHRYSIRIVGCDDQVLCRNIDSVDQFYQWIKIFEFRDFTLRDIREYIDDCY